MEWLKNAGGKIQKIIFKKSLDFVLNPFLRRKIAGGQVDVSYDDEWSNNKVIDLEFEPEAVNEVIGNSSIITIKRLFIGCLELSFPKSLINLNFGIVGSFRAQAKNVELVIKLNQQKIFDTENMSINSILNSYIEDEFGQNASKIAAEDQFTQESEKTLLNFIVNFLFHTKLNIENLLIRLEMQNDDNSVSVFHIRMKKLALYDPLIDEKVNELYLDMAGLTVDFFEDHFNIDEIDETKLYLVDSDNKNRIFVGAKGENDDDVIRLHVKYRLVESKLYSFIGLSMPYYNLDISIEDTQKLTKIVNKFTIEKKEEVINKDQSTLGSTINTNIKEHLSKLSSIAFDSEDEYVSAIDFDEFTNIEDESQSTYDNQQSTITTNMNVTSFTIEDVEVSITNGSIILDKQLFMEMGIKFSYNSKNPKEIYSLTIDTFKGSFLHKDSDNNYTIPFFNIKFSNPIKGQLNDEERGENFEIIKQNKYEPGILNHYLRSKRNSGPFKPIISVFEGKEKISEPLDQEDYLTFKKITLEKSKLIISVPINDITVNIDKNQYAFLINIINKLLISEPSKPEDNKSKKDKLLRHNNLILSSIDLSIDKFTFKVHIDDEEKKKNIRDYVLEANNLDVFLINNYEGTGTDYKCIRIRDIQIYEVDNETKIENLILEKLPFNQKDPNHQNVIITMRTYYDKALKVEQSLKRIDLYGFNLYYYKNPNYLELSSFFLIDPFIQFPVITDHIIDKTYLSIHNSCISISLKSREKIQLAVTLGSIEIFQQIIYPINMKNESVIYIKLFKSSLYHEGKEMIPDQQFNDMFSLHHFWIKRNMHKFGNLDFLELTLTTQTENYPRTLISISNHQLCLDICSDSVNTLALFIFEMLDLTNAEAEKNIEQEEKEKKIGEIIDLNENLEFFIESPIIGKNKDQFKVNSKSDKINDLPTVTWNNDEKRIIITDENYIHNEKHDIKRFTISNEMKEVDYVYELKDFNLSIRLRPNKEKDNDYEPFNSHSNAQGMHFYLVGINLQIVTDISGQRQYRLVLNDFTILDRLINSSWDKFLCADRRRKRKRSLLSSTVNNFLLRNKKESPPYWTVKMYMEPLKMNIDSKTFAFLLEFYEKVKPLTQIKFKQNEDENEEEVPLYFEYIDIGPVICDIDFKATKLDMKNLTNPLEWRNLVHLEHANVHLSSFQSKRIVGLQNLTKTIFNEWKPDIQRALISVPASIRGLRHIVLFGSALTDLVVIPFQEYKKGGSLPLAFLESSANAITKITSETLGLLAYVANAAVGGLEIGEKFLVGKRNDIKVSKYANQPSNVTEGLQQGYESVVNALQDTKNRVFMMPLEEYEKNGIPGFAKGFLIATPFAVIKPVMGATRGVAQVLIGFRNTINIDEKIDADSKYKKKDWEPSTP